jgi:hypothetical protein
MSTSSLSDEIQFHTQGSDDSYGGITITSGVEEMSLPNSTNRVMAV